MPHAEAIQSLWIGDELPPWCQLSIRSFLDHGHPYHLFCYSEMSGIPAGTTVRDARELFAEDEVFVYESGPGKGSVSAFSNLFRYKLLHEYGGWWADTDVVCLQPFDFRRDYVFATEIDEDKTSGIASCVIRVPPNTELMRFCIDETLATRGPDLKWGDIGPKLLHRGVARSANLMAHAEPARSFCPIHWFKHESLFGPLSGFRPFRGSYGLHLWNELWRRQLGELSPWKTSVCARLFRKHGFQNGVAQTLEFARRRAREKARAEAEGRSL